MAERNARVFTRAMNRDGESVQRGSDWRRAEIGERGGALAFRAWREVGAGRSVRAARNTRSVAAVRDGGREV